MEPGTDLTSLTPISPCHMLLVYDKYGHLKGTVTPMDVLGAIAGGFFVLADDNFASIAAAVCQGRTVYNNIKTVISWTLPSNAGEAMTIIVALLAGIALPITAVQTSGSI